MSIPANVTLEIKKRGKNPYLHGERLFLPPEGKHNRTGIVRGLV